MKGYWIARGDVTDEALYREYGKRALPVIETFGGRLIVLGGRATTPEGRDWARNVVIEFDFVMRATDAASGETIERPGRERIVFTDAGLIAVIEVVA